MLGFLKRLFGWLAKGDAPRPVAPVDAVAPFAPAPFMPEPVAPEPVPFIPAPYVSQATPLVPVPAPMQAPTLAFPPEEPSGYEMVHSVGNPDAYMIGLVGEQDHVMAVRALVPGTPIALELEPDNPQDASAIAAVDGRGRVIGYIAQESWLREAIYGAGASFAARVLAVEMGSRGFREVVLEVEPSEEPLRERHYQYPR